MNDQPTHRLSGPPLILTINGVWGAKTSSVSVGLGPWGGTTRSERHKQRIRNPQPSHHLLSRQRVRTPLPAFGGLGLPPTLSQIRMGFLASTRSAGRQQLSARYLTTRRSGLVTR